MEMIERCAKAIYAKLNDEMRGDGYLSDISDDMTDVVVDGRVDLLAVARAVIGELLKPTKEMFEASKDYMDFPSTSTLWWEAMINGALKEHGDKR